jgi:hypothetical protein
MQSSLRAEVITTHTLNLVRFALVLSDTLFMNAELPIRAGNVVV